MKIYVFDFVFLFMLFFIFKVWNIENFEKEKLVEVYENFVCILILVKNMLFSGFLKVVKVR